MKSNNSVVMRWTSLALFCSLVVGLAHLVLSDNSYTSNNYTEFNITINEENLLQFEFDWELSSKFQHFHFLTNFENHEKIILQINIKNMIEQNSLCRNKTSLQNTQFSYDEKEALVIEYNRKKKPLYSGNSIYA